METAGKGERHRECLRLEIDYEYMCQPCQSDGKNQEVEGMCTDCQKYLCKRCFDSHTISSMVSNHVFLDRQTLLNKNNPLSEKDQFIDMCPEHVGKEIEYYCKNHLFLGCTVCIEKQHRKCTGVDYIPDIANDLTINKEFTEFKTHLTSIDNKLKEVVNYIKEKGELVTKRHTEAIRALREYRQEINDALDKIENEIIEKAEQIKSEHMKKLSSISDQIEISKTEVQDIISKTDILQEAKQNSNLYIMAMQSTGKFKILYDKLAVLGDIKVIRGCIYKPNIGLLEMLQGPIGLGQICEIGPITGVQHSVDINVRSTTDAKMCQISGCTILPDNQSIVVTDSNNRKIKMCNIIQGSVTSELELKKIEPWDITNIGDSQVAVTVPGGNKILFITTDQVLTVHRDVKVSGECRGIVQCSDGRLIVSFDGPQKVEIMKLDGTVLSTIVKDNKGNDAFSIPYYVTISTDNKTMYVSNYGTSTVVGMRLDGTVVATYKDSQLSGPQKVALDVDDMVYICGCSSHNIHQVTGDCRKVQLLMTKADGIKDPWSICFNEIEDKFYVGRWNNDKVRVFLALRH